MEVGAGDAVAVASQMPSRDHAPADLAAAAEPATPTGRSGPASAPARLLPWAAAAVCTACSVTGLGFELVTRSTRVPVDFGTRDGTTASAMVFTAVPIVGALVASRRAGRLIGWLFIALGATMAVWVLADGLAVYGLRTHPGAIAGARWFAWLANWIWIPGWALTAVAGLVFPTGRLPSRRWRLVLWTLGVVTTAFSGATAVASGQLTNYLFQPNPAGALDLGVSGRTVKLIGDGALGAVGLAVVGSLLVRRRRARGDEREQIKWLTWAAALAVGIVVSFVVLEGVGGRVRWAEGWVLAVGILIPVAAGVAVLKYRLYGIDLVISKTVVFGTLAAFITAVYSVVVVGIGALLDAPRSSPALSIVATALVAFAFEPVRARAERLANRIVYGERATPYEILAAFSERVSDAFATDNVLDRMVAVVAEGVAARRASIWLHSDASLRRVAHWPDQAADVDPISFPDPDGDVPQLPDAQRAFPVRHEGELLGALTVTIAPGEHLDRTREMLLADLALQAGLVLRNVRLIAELRASRQRVVAAGDAERRRLERNLHDGAQQQLVALAIKLRLAKDLVADDPDEAQAMLDALRAEASDALTNLRDLARGIYPPLLADQGLVVALQSQAGKAPLAVDVRTEDVARYPQEVEAAVYFCCLEALQNIAKYADAPSAVISLVGGLDHLTFVVTDDGRGIAPGTPRGSGLQNMVDRLAALDGTLDITSTPGQGTTLTGRLPVRG